MSLDTLLEAAEFLEWRNQTKTRDDDATQEPHGYPRNTTNGGSDTSPDSSNSGQNMYITFMDLEDLKDKRRAGGAGTRETHNKLEKNRRAHLKECFDFLKKQIPSLEDKRSSNLGILRGSIRYIQALKRKEREYEQEMQRLAREKISLRERMSSLKMELAAMDIEVDLNQWKFLPEECGSTSTSTATEQGSPICSEDEEDEELHTLKRKRHPSNTSKDITGKDSKPLYAGAQTSSKSPADTLPQANNLTMLIPPALNQKPAIISIPKSLASLSHVVATTTITKQTADGKPPVTKLLAQTLERRQQKQMELQKQNVFTSANTARTGTLLNIPRPPSSQAVRQTNPPRQQLAFPIAGLGAQILATSPAAQLAALNRLAAQASVSMPASGITAFPISTLAKGITQPFLVSMGGLANLPQSTTTTTTSAMNSTSTVTTSSAVTQVATSGNRPSALQAALNTSALPVQTIPVTAIAAVPTLRPILGAAGTPAQMFGQFPFNLLATHTLPRSSVPPVVGQATAATTGQTATCSSALQSPAVHQLIAAQGAQLMSPMTVMSPAAVHLTPGLTQTQLSTMLSQPLLKQIPFPVFPQGLIQGAQVGGVLGQPVVKPLVVVPNVVTTSTGGNATVSLVTTSSS